MSDSFYCLSYSYLLLSFHSPLSNPINSYTLFPPDMWIPHIIHIILGKCYCEWSELKFILLFLTPHTPVMYHYPLIRENIQLLFFWASLISLSMIFSNSIQLFANAIILFLWLNSIPLCIYISEFLYPLIC